MQYFGAVGLDNVHPPASISVPKSYAQAMASLQAEEWEAAMRKEVHTLGVPSTTVPPGCSVISTRWAFRVKQTDDSKQGFWYKDGRNHMGWGASQYLLRFAVSRVKRLLLTSRHHEIGQYSRCTYKPFTGSFKRTSTPSKHQASKRQAR